MEDRRKFAPARHGRFPDRPLVGGARVVSSPINSALFLTAMRWLSALGSLLVLFAIATCGGDDSAPTITHTLRPSAIITATPTPVPPGTPPADTEQRIRRCLDTAGATAEEALQALSPCRAFAGIASVNAFAGEGDIPVVLIDVTTQFSAVDVALVAWYENGSWWVQSLNRMLTLDARLRPQESSRNGDPRSTARLVVGDKTRLGVIHSENAMGSGAHEGYLLLELIDGRWVAAWDSNRTAIRELSHTRIEFEGPGVDTIHVRGGSWYMKDAKARIFPESNAGPHRWFEQTWVREGDEYIMQSGRVIPSPYNTLVEFVYALGTGDDQTAASLVTDVSLLDRARTVLLDSRLPGPWSGFCGEEPPCTIVASDDRGARVEMVPDAEDWLISGIEPCTYRYDSTGGHCD